MGCFRILEIKKNGDLFCLLLQPPFDNQSFALPHSVWVECTSTHSLQVGDWISLEGQKSNDPKMATRLTANQSGGLLQLQNKTMNPRRIQGVKMRTKVENATRRFFQEEGYLETRTPLLVKSPGMEPHIRPFLTNGGSYLPTSPEFAMKKLLASGHHQIFQICPAFRFEPHSPQHLQEFTLLEWYRSGFDENALMAETENYISSIAKQIFGKSELSIDGKSVSLVPPWPRKSVRSLFHEYLEIDLHAHSSIESMQNLCERFLSKSRTETSNLSLNDQTADLPTTGSASWSPHQPNRSSNKWPSHWDDLYFLLWLNLIEPRLPKYQPFFVTEFPASQAALAQKAVKPDGYAYARRFEVFLGGYELANAFFELTDAQEQQKRFTEDMNLRTKIYGNSFPKNPVDEEFLQALREGIAPTSGIALGLDRLIMLFANETQIENTFWITPTESTAYPTNDSAVENPSRC